MKYIYAIFIGLILSNPSFACKFRELPVNELVSRTDVIFIGLVEESFDARSGAKVLPGKIKVIQSFKGNLEFKSIPLISDNSSCGINFQKGQIWLILGNKTITGIVANAPSGSMLFSNPVAKEQVAYIESIDAVLKTHK